MTSYRFAHKALAPLALAVALIASLAACVPVTPVPPVTPAAQDLEAGLPTLPPVVEYDLGEATLVQARFPQDSRFRNMPVRLNGVIAAPPEGGPYPVVLILHGTHPGCPEVEHGIDRWPCDPAVEQPNYRGFGYLARALAAQGYVALSININAENTFGFGEPIPGERLRQLVDLHLGALAEASAGGTHDFGLDLAGRADLGRLAVLGHSRGGDVAITLARDLAAEAERGQVTYGPVDGLLLIAPSPGFADPAGGVPSPLATLLPACDADVVNQEGQVFYEATRLETTHDWATSAWLERANHNHFNDILPGDPFGLNGRTDCDPLLAPEAQRAFLVTYAADFLTTIFSRDPAQIRAAMGRLGIDVRAPAVDRLYGQAAQAMLLPTSRLRLPLLTPTGVDDFATSPFGSAVIVEGVTADFCPPGSYTPITAPELVACRRSHVVVPGQPAHAVVSWDAPGGVLRFALPPGLDNLLLFDAVSLRAAVDPLSPRNTAGAPQTFSVRLTDRQGRSAVVPVRADEPALRFPEGEPGEPFLETPLFTGRAPLLPVRIPLSSFEGVNLASIAEVALVFDQTDSGTLFMADVELARSPIGSQETLGEPPSAELITAAEAGDVEAMRQLANLYRPTEALGVQYGNLEQAVYWYRRACTAGYANAQVDFYEFARAQADVGHAAYLEEATACLEDAIRQGHRDAIIHGAFIEQDYATAFFLYALLEDTEPDIARQRESFADQLTQAEIDEAENAAAEWRAANPIKDYEDFFAEVDSPFRQPASQQGS